MLKKTPITQYPKFPTSDWLGGEVTHFKIEITSSQQISMLFLHFQTSTTAALILVKTEEYVRMTLTITLVHVILDSRAKTAALVRDINSSF